MSCLPSPKWFQTCTLSLQFKFINVTEFLALIYDQKCNDHVLSQWFLVNELTVYRASCCKKNTKKNKKNLDVIMVFSPNFLM